MKESSHPAWNGIVNRGGSGPPPLPHDAPRILSFPPLISDAHISFSLRITVPQPLAHTSAHITAQIFIPPSLPPFPPPFLRLPHCADFLISELASPLSEFSPLIPLCLRYIEILIFHFLHPSSSFFFFKSRIISGGTKLIIEVKQSDRFRFYVLFLLLLRLFLFFLFIWSIVLL